MVKKMWNHVVSPTHTTAHSIDAYRCSSGEIDAVKDVIFVASISYIRLIAWQSWCKWLI